MSLRGYYVVYVLVTHFVQAKTFCCKVNISLSLFYSSPTARTPRPAQPSASITPSLEMGFFTRGEKNKEEKSLSKSSDDTVPGYVKPKPTGLRLLTALMYLLSVVFLILVEIGNINNKAVIRDTYFIKIGLANVIPESVPNAVFINSIAQSIGLHDFYQVGLWNFCEGYNGQGITYCSAPKTLYWFNPVKILLNELLAGASIALPTNITDILDLVRVISMWMFACFLVGIILTFLCIFLVPLGFSQKPRWQHKAKRIFLRQLPVTILSFLALLFTAVGTVMATAMFVIFRNTFTSAGDLNITAELGTPMLAFMWIAVGFNLIGFCMQLGTCCGVCCCTGRKKAERKSQMVQTEKSRSRSRERGRFGFKRSRGSE